MSELSADGLAETLVAFANGDGGTVLLGATPTGRSPASLQIEDAESLLRAALAQCRPLVRTEWEPFEDRAGCGGRIHVPRSTELHSLADGRVLVRSHEGNELLDGGKISIWRRPRPAAISSRKSVAGAARTDLDDEVIQDFLQRRAAHLGRDLGQTEEELLAAIGALKPQGQPTVAGMLLFGRDPQFFMPQSGAVYVRFAGTEPRAPRGRPSTPAARSSTARWRASSRVAGRSCSRRCAARRWCAACKREDRHVYPLFAVREALVNAVCHRDYRLSGRRVEVRQFDDRLEISSPGGLPGYITLDNIVEEHFSRNPRLVNGLFEWGYIEQLGLGIDRMIEEMVQAGHPAPEFKPTPYSFTVVLKRGSGTPGSAARAVPEWAKGLNERQIRALQYLQQYGRITNREYHDLCPDVSPETLRLDLADLVEKGLVMKIGDKKGTYYILK